MVMGNPRQIQDTGERLGKRLPSREPAYATPTTTSRPIAMISLNDIQEARARFEGNVTQTPLVWSQSFSRLTGRDVYLKVECMQRAGSFKIRGALNVLTRLDGQPVVAASAGNHAQGVALAAAFTGSPCTVFMPETAAIPKVKATEDYGAVVRLVGVSLADAVDAAKLFSEETGARLLHT